MKSMLKLTALLGAASMLLSAADFNAYAEDTAVTTAPVSVPTEEEEPGIPALSSGAINAGYRHGRTLAKIREDDTFNMTVTTYIPISNFTEGLFVTDFDTEDIFCIAHSNTSFNPLTPTAWSNECSIWGSFLKVDSYFMDVKYLGVGNEFSYSIYYSVDGTGISVPLSFAIPECEETVPEEKPEEDLSVPSYTLDSVSSNELKAGSSATVKIDLRSVGSGTVSTVAAMLTSSDPDVKVEDLSEKRSAITNPSYSFKISAPDTASPGVYSLNLSVTVFNKNGESAGSYTYSIPVTVTSDINSSALSVKAYKTSKKTVKPDDSFNLTLTFENNCGIDLENIEVTLAGLDSTKFVLDGGFSKQNVSIKDGKTGSVTFPLIACSGITSVRENIGVQASYFINPSKPDSAQTLETSVVVNCKPESEKQELGKHDLTMTDYKVSSSAVAEKTRFTLSVTLENTSKNKIENARLSILGLDGIKFAVNSGLTYVDFNIDAGKSKTFSFELLGCEGISSIREVIPILIEYGTVSSEASVTVSCSPKEEKEEDKEGEVFAPNIIIESYDFGDEYVIAGQTFPLSVIVKNTSSSAVIENLKVTVNGASNNLDGGVAYSPANSSNSFFFERLGSKETTEIALDLLAKGDATPNSYPVEIYFTYEYSTGGKHYQASPVTETITIPLQQEDRLTVNQPEAPNYAVNVGELCYISTSLVNKGKSGVYNVSASVEGEGFDLSTGAYYIGNISSGSEEYYDAQLTPNTEGEIKGEIVITYEDANGTEKEQRVPFSFTAAQFNYEEMYGMGYEDPMGGAVDGAVSEEMPEGGSFNWIPIAIGAAVVIAVVVIIIVVVKKRKRKKELEDEDEDI